MTIQRRRTCLEDERKKKKESHSKAAEIKQTKKTRKKEKATLHTEIDLYIHTHIGDMYV